MVIGKRYLRRSSDFSLSHWTESPFLIEHGRARKCGDIASGHDPRRRNSTRETTGRMRLISKKFDGRPLLEQRRDGRLQFCIAFRDMASGSNAAQFDKRLHTAVRSGTVSPGVFSWIYW